MCLTGRLHSSKFYSSKLLTTLFVKIFHHQTHLRHTVICLTSIVYDLHLKAMCVYMHAYEKTSVHVSTHKKLLWLVCHMHVALNLLQTCTIVSAIGCNVTTSKCRHYAVV